MRHGVVLLERKTKDGQAVFSIIFDVAKLSEVALSSYPIR